MEVTRTEFKDGSAKEHDLEGVLKLDGRLSELPKAQSIPSGEASSAWRELPPKKEQEQEDDESLNFVTSFSAREMGKLDLGRDSRSGSAVVLEVASPIHESEAESRAAGEASIGENGDLLLRTEQDDYVILPHELIRYLEHVNVIRLPDSDASEASWRWTYDQPHAITLHHVGEFTEVASNEGPQCSLLYREIEIKGNPFSAGDIVWRVLVTPFAAVVDVTLSVAIIVAILESDDDDEF